MNKTTKHIRLTLKLSFIALFIIGINACVNEAKHQGNTVEEDTQLLPEDTIKGLQIKEIFYSLPSPIELSILFKNEDITFNTGILHDVNAIDQYNIQKKQALNLGVYGADLSYAGIFEKHQEAIQYYNNCKKLAESLGVVDEEYGALLKRLESNQNNKDSILNIISSFFLSNDANLKESQQDNLASYTLAGGWIEGMYLGTQMHSNENNEGIKSILITQKNALQSLIMLLDETNINGDDELFIGMQELLSLYNKIELKKESSNKEKVEEEEGKLVFNTTKVSADISNELFEEIKSKIEELRATIIQ